MRHLVIVAALVAFAAGACDETAMALGCEACFSPTSTVNAPLFNSSHWSGVYPEQRPYEHRLQLPSTETPLMMENLTGEDP